MYQFNFEDAWIFFAIHMASEPNQSTGLRSIIGAGDYINKAVIGHDEMNSACKKFLYLKFIAQEGNKLKITKCGEQFIESIHLNNIKVGHPCELADEIFKHLKCYKLKDICDIECFTHSEFALVQKQYTEEMQKLIKQILRDLKK